MRAFLDDDRARWGQGWDGLPVLGGRDLLATLGKDVSVALGIGGNPLRAEIAAAVLGSGVDLATVVHPTAVVSRGVGLGPGTLRGPARRAPYRCARRPRLHRQLVRSGRARLLARGLGTRFPRRGARGRVRIGEGAHVALGAIILPGLALGPWATLGAGAVMIHSMPDYATAVGVPARVRDPKRRHA